MCVGMCLWCILYGRYSSTKLQPQTSVVLILIFMCISVRFETLCVILAANIILKSQNISLYESTIIYPITELTLYSSGSWICGQRVSPCLLKCIRSPFSEGGCTNGFLPPTSHPACTTCFLCFASSLSPRTHATEMLLKEQEMQVPMPQPRDWCSSLQQC